MVTTKNNGLSYDVKFLITLVSLFVLYPVGLILMYMWMSWPKWLKVMITLPAVYAVIVGFILAIDFSRSVRQERRQIIRMEENLEESDLLLNCSTDCAASFTGEEYDYCVKDCTD